MLVLQPLSKRRIWGTSKLHNYSGNKNIGKIGSVYSVTAIDGLSSTFSHPSFDETDLYTAIEKHPEQFGLKKGEVYPIIISMTASGTNLSIQVHPTDEYAQNNEGKPTGKSESWYFIDPPKIGWIYAESKLMDKNLIEENMKTGNFEDVVDKVEVNQGDLVYIPSGTLHALTTGSLVYEIQQATDITYRFYDYNRLDVDGNKRELHLEKAIATLKTDNRVKKSDFEINQLQLEEPYTILRTILANSYHNDSSIAQCITVLKGILIANYEEVIAGQSILVFPDETVQINQSAEVVIATPKRYYIKD